MLIMLIAMYETYGDLTQRKQRQTDHIRIALLMSKDFSIYSFANEVANKASCEVKSSVDFGPVWCMAV